MSARIRAYIRQQHWGMLATFLVLAGGTAYATHPGGANTISNGDISDGEVQSADVKNDSLTTDDVAQNTLGFRETATSASDEIKFGSIDEFDVADDSLGFRETATSASDEIKAGSIDHFDVADGSLQRQDFQDGVLPKARSAESSANSLSTDFEQITARFVPEGTWVAFANVRSGGTNDGLGGFTPEITCELRDPGGRIGYGIDVIPDEYDDDVDDWECHHQW